MYTSKTPKLLLMLLTAVLFLGQGRMMAQCDYPTAQKQFNQQEYIKAEKCLKSLIPQNPKDEKLHYLLGEVYWETERYDESKRSYQEGINRGARYVMNYIGLLKHQVKADQYDDAMKTLAKAKDLNRNDNIDVSVETALAFLVSKDSRYLDQAERLLRNAEDKAPNNKLVYIGLGDLYHQQGIGELPLDNYMKAIELEPTFMKGYLRAGQELKKEGELNKANDVFQKGLDQNPGYAPLYREKGELWYGAGQYEKALENMRKYVELTNNDLSAKMRLASFLYLTKNYEEALGLIDEIGSDTNSVVMTRVKAYCQIELKKADEGLVTLDQYFKMVKAKDQLADDYIYKGKAFLVKKDYTQAEADFNKALEMDPTRGEVFAEIGQVYYKQKEYVKAADAYEKIVESGTAKFKEYFYYSTSCFRAIDTLQCKSPSTDTARAEKATAAFLEKYPNSHVPHLHTARVKTLKDPGSKAGAAMADYEKTIEMMGEKITKYKNDYAESMGYIGAYHMLVKEDCATAIPFFDKILEIKPNDSRAVAGKAACQEFIDAGGGTTDGE